MNENNGSYPAQGGMAIPLAITAPDGIPESLFPRDLTGGVCVTCINRDHCVWVENNKIYCEHYE